MSTSSPSLLFYSPFWVVENLVPAHRNISGYKENKKKYKENFMWVVDEDEKIVHKGQRQPKQRFISKWCF